MPLIPDAMNRRNFFSLAALSLGALLARKAAGLPGYAPIAKPPKGSMFDLPPLDLGQMRQAQMLAEASHSHSINDPGHSHNVLDNGHWHTIEDPGHCMQIANPNWIPCDGQWVFIDGAGVHYVDGKPKPMHYVHYTLE